MFDRLTVNDLTLDLYPGRGDLPPVLLIPGLFAGGWMWETVAQAINQAGYRVALPVEPLGAHPDVAQPDALSAEFARTMRWLYDEPAVIAGNSMGGLVGLKLVTEFAIPARALVMSGAPGLGEAARPPAVGSLRSVSRSLSQQQAALLFHDRSKVTDEMIDRCFDAWDEPKKKLNILRALRNTRDYDARPLFGRVTCPTLLAWGAEDAICPASDWEAVVPLFPNARFVGIPDSGHSPMLETPDPMINALFEFLSTTTPSAEQEAAAAELRTDGRAHVGAIRLPMAG